MTIRETLEIGPGSIVALDRMTGEPVDLLVNGHTHRPRRGRRDRRGVRPAHHARRLAQAPPRRRCLAPRCPELTGRAARPAGARSRPRSGRPPRSACRAPPAPATTRTSPARDAEQRRPGGAGARRSPGRPGRRRDAHLPAVAVAADDGGATGAGRDAQMDAGRRAADRTTGAWHRVCTPVPGTGPGATCSGSAAQRRNDGVVRVDPLLQRAPDRAQDLRHARLADAEHPADLRALHVLDVQEHEDGLLALAQ